MKKDIWMYSLCDESYYGGEDSEQDVIELAIEENNLKDGDTFWVSKMELFKPPKFSDVFDADTIAEQMDDFLYDNDSPYEDTHFLWHKDHKRLLEKMLDETWEKFLSVEGRFVEYYVAANSKKITVGE